MGELSKDFIKQEFEKFKETDHSLIRSVYGQPKGKTFIGQVFHFYTQSNDFDKDGNSLYDLHAYPIAKVVIAGQDSHYKEDDYVRLYDVEIRNYKNPANEALQKLPKDTNFKEEAQRPREYYTRMPKLFGRSTMGLDLFSLLDENSRIEYFLIDDSKAIVPLNEDKLDVLFG